VIGSNGLQQSGGRSDSCSDSEFSGKVAMRRSGAAVVLAVLSGVVPPAAFGQAPPATSHASGTFEVKTTAQTPKEAPVSRPAMDNTVQGDLKGTSQGEMLGVFTPVKGSAGYVAIERVSGTLQGRRGTFLLQHSGTMTRGAQQLSITVVPDSGTDQLPGLTGSMTIKIADGKHSYDFAYSLPAGG